MNPAFHYPYASEVGSERELIQIVEQKIIESKLVAICYKKRKAKFMKNIVKNCNSKVIGIVLLCLILIILALISWNLLFPSYDGAVTAKVFQNNQLLYTIPLYEITEPYELTIETESGGKNILLISKDQISVTYANCPDQVCVKRGVVSYSEIPVVCMPNQLVIEFEKQGEEAKVDG